MDLVELIKKTVTENHITAYEIAKNTSISANTVRNILNDSKTKAKQKTLLIILNYLETAIVGTKAKYELNPEVIRQVADTTSQYNTNFTDLKIDDKLNIIYKLLQQQQAAITDISLGISGLLIEDETKALKKETK